MAYEGKDTISSKAWVIKCQKGQTPLHMERRKQFVKKQNVRSLLKSMSVRC